MAMEKFTPLLCTLDQFRLHRSLMDVPAEAKDNALMLDLIEQSSADFIGEIRRVPMPFIDLREQQSMSARILSFDADLLEIRSLYYGTVALDADHYQLSPLNTWPKRYLEAVRGSCEPLPCWPSSRNPILLAGVWGYVPHYPVCWKPIFKLVANLTTTATTATVTDDEMARLEIGMYLRTAYDVDGLFEMMQVAALKDNVVTFSRGELGTTATVQTATTLAPVQMWRFQQLPDIAGAVMEMAAFKYLHKDAIGATVKVYEGGIVSVESLDVSVMKTIIRHRRKPGRQF